jgi:CAAX protease family protein
VHFIDPISPPEFPPPSLAPVPAPVEHGDRAPVDMVDVLFIVVIAMVAFIFCSLIAGGIYWFNHRSQHLTPDALSKAFSRDALYLVSLQLAAYLMVVGSMAFLAWGRHQSTLAQTISWNAPSLRLAWYAVAGGLALALFSDIGDIVLSRWIPKDLPITELFHDRTSAFLLAGFGILVAPLVEELLFRGFLYPALARLIGRILGSLTAGDPAAARSTGAIGSILITASLFTLLHGAQLGYSWAPLLLIFVVGITLTAIRAATRSVALCVLVHMTYNFALLAQTFAATHGFRQMQGV